MINLALMTLSASSLERRITVMQRRRKSSPFVSSMLTTLATVMLCLACATNAPSVARPLNLQTRLAPPADNGDYDAEYLRGFVTGYTGGIENDQQYWVLYNPDWSIRRFEVGVEGAVEMVDSTSDRMYGFEINRRPTPGKHYDLLNSLMKKFPEIWNTEGHFMKSANSIQVRSGTDSATINWAYLGPTEQE